MRDAPRGTLPAAVLERIILIAFPRPRLFASEPLGDGLRNTNIKLYLDAPPEPVVLRIYEHDPSLCQKELDLMRLVCGAVPVPEVIYAAPAGWEDLPPFTFARWIDGIGFRELKRTGDAQDIAQAARAAGEILAGIGRFSFPKPGWLSSGPSVGAPLLDGVNPIPRFVDLCLASANLRSRMPAELRDHTHALVWSCAAEYARLDAECRLVHGDFNKRNVLMRRAAGRWQVAAVLDWEFAVSSSPLADAGSFLRYERAARPLLEPHFSAGFQDAGGHLPHHWRRLARLIDLAALCESLTHDRLPETVVAELVELVRATIEDRDPVWTPIA